MAYVNWKNPVSGDWNTAADWDDGAVPPGGSVTVAIDVKGAGYVVTSSAFIDVSSLTLDQGDGEFLQTGGQIETPDIEIDSGIVSLNAANRLGGGGVVVNGGVLEVGSSQALGAGAELGSLTIGAGEVLGTANVRIVSPIFIGFVDEAPIIAAAHGTTLDIGVGGWALPRDNFTPNFGGGGQDGTVVLHVPSFSNGGGGAGGPANTEIQSGTVKAGDSHAGDILQAPVVYAGATLDLAGFNMSLGGLLGSGTVTDSGAGATLTVNADLGVGSGPDIFSGAITGALSLVVGGVLTLTGANTYTGNTTIGPGNFSGAPGTSGGIPYAGPILTIGTGGSLAGGNIDVEGEFIIDSDDAVTLTSAIGGSEGVFIQEGEGTTTINSANDFSGRTLIDHGTLAVGNADALGTSTVRLRDGSELLGTANETITNALQAYGSMTIAAAHGTTLDIGSGGLATPEFGSSSTDTFVFGAAGQDGTVIYDTSSDGDDDTNNFAGVMEVRAGTLMFKPDMFSAGEFLPSFGRGIVVDAGATLDLAGSGNSFHFAISGLTGAGTITDSGAGSTNLVTSGMNFSGTISGALNLEFQGDGLLSGLSEYTGDTQLDRSAVVTNAGTFDLVGDSGIDPNAEEFGNKPDPTEAFINDGLFEKTGGGLSQVFVQFINNGTIAVTSGSVVFGAGFTNNGTVQGTLSESGGIWTITAAGNNAAPAAATTANIVLRDSTTGSFEIYNIGNNAVLGGPYQLNQLGSEWKVAGVGGFNGTDSSDVLVRDNTGAFLMIDVSNNNVTGATSMGQVGLEWSVAGFGDFSDKAGEADMLMRNSSTGAFEVFDIANGQFTGFHALGQVGPEWQVSGFGDFSGNANETDMLMRNSNTGAFELYDITNNSFTGFHSLNALGSGWTAVGFGDFSGNANETDMMARNASTGAFEIIDIRNNALLSPNVLGTIGAGLQVAGFGDFSGNANETDMLMRDPATGALTVYDISHNAVTGNSVLAQPGVGFQVAGVTANAPGGAFSPPSGQMTASSTASTSSSTSGTQGVVSNPGTITTNVAWADTTVSGDWTDAADWDGGFVPGSGDDVTVGGSFSDFVLTITTDVSAKSLTADAQGLFFGGGVLLENAGSLTLGLGGLVVTAGKVVLNRANTIGGPGTELTGGILSIGNAGALGTGALTLDGGELLGTVDETLANPINVSNDNFSTIAAAHGTTLDIGSGGWLPEFNNVVPDFGGSGQDGTVVLHVASYQNSGGAGGPGQSEIQSGTVKAGDANAGLLLQAPIVDAGATLDLAGFNMSLQGLQGSGSVIDSGAAATLTVVGNVSTPEVFAGTITGSISLLVFGVTLSGANTYTGTTTIGESGHGIGGAVLIISTGGSIGSGAIDDEGSLVIDSSNAVTLNNTISGPGDFEQEGAGTTSINGANTSFTGQTFISAGTLAVGNGAALGTNTITLVGGELLGTANETIANNLSLFHTSTIAAAHGTTLHIGAGVTTHEQEFGDTLYFGAAGQDGTVVWDGGTVAGETSPQAIEVRAGTLQAGSNSDHGLPEFADQFVIDAGATVDLAGQTQSFLMHNLAGTGTLTDSGAEAGLSLDDAVFAGTVSGALGLDISTSSLFSGLSEATGDTSIAALTTLTNTGTYDLISNSDILGSDDPTASFVNDSLFEKTGGGALSEVSAAFTNNGTLDDSNGSLLFSDGLINNGTIDVTSGSVTIKGGFTNHGTIDGVLSEGGNNTWTITPTGSNAAPPSGTSADIILRNSSTGAFEIYDAGHNALLAGPDQLNQLGSEWSVAGFGNFSGTDTADMLVYDTSNNFTVIDISGNNVTGASYAGQAVQAINSGGFPFTLQYRFAGLGDFSSKPGETDLLMRDTDPDTDTGAFELFDIANGSISSLHSMGQVGPEWSVAGFGDFSGNASETDMLMRRTDGTFEIFDIANNSYSGFHALGQVGPEWQVAGFGDFSGNANETDMLMRNSSTGAFELYDIANNLFTGFHALGQVGPEWQVAGFGDFSGNTNETDMLMRTTSTGAFEVYDISHNAFGTITAMGQAATAWQVVGVTSASQMTQAIASLSSGGSSTSGATASGADSQSAASDSLITTPHA